MRYVLDVNVALKWVLAEPDSPKANKLRDDFRKSVHELLSPDVFPVEIAHALTRAERQKRIAVGDSGPLLADVLLTCPTLHPYQPLLLRATEISSGLRVGVYDCLYVALAERERCALVTADDKLIKHLQARFPFITDLKTLP
jgi:predicted nucleic acid-binding protein